MKFKEKQRILNKAVVRRLTTIEELQEYHVRAHNANDPQPQISSMKTDIAALKERYRELEERQNLTRDHVKALETQIAALQARKVGRPKKGSNA